MISDVANLSFQNAFKQYFAELDANVRDWDELFKDMNDEGGNVAFVRSNESGEIVGEPVYMKHLESNSLGMEASGREIQLRILQMNFPSPHQGAVEKRRNWN